MESQRLSICDDLFSDSLVGRSLVVLMYGPKLRKAVSAIRRVRQQKVIWDR